MDINIIARLLQTMDAVGIMEAVIEPDEQGGTRIRAANEARTIAVFDTIPESLTTLPIGIPSVKGLLHRFNLFDLDKASLDFDDNGTEVRNLTIKQGRKKASFRFSESSKLKVPKKIPSETPIEGMEFSKEYVDYLNNAMSAMGFTGNKKKQTVGISCESGTMKITVHDGESDSFVDYVEVGDVEDFSNGQWEVDPFKKVMIQSAKQSEDQKARFSITPSAKIAAFDMGIIDVMLIPMVDK